MPATTLRWVVVGLFLLPAIAQAEPAKDGVTFDGSSSFAVSDKTSPLDLASFSVSAWVKVKTAGHSQIFVSRGGAAEQFTLYLYNNRVRMLVQTGEGKYTHANVPAPETGKWIHYAGTYDGQQIKLYVDGKLQAGGQGAGLHASLKSQALFRRTRAHRTQSQWAVGRHSDLLPAAFKRRSRRHARRDKAPAEGLVGRWTSDSMDDMRWKNVAGSGLTARYLTGSQLECTKGRRLPRHLVFESASERRVCVQVQRRHGHLLLQP